MARKRLVSPELFIHPVLGKVDDALSLVFIGLWTQADRRGIFRWRPDVLKLALRPYKDDDFEEILCRLVAGGFIRRYTVDGEEFGQIPKFNKWQTFHINEKPSNLPGPPPEHRHNTVPAPCEHGVSTPVAVAVTVTDTVAVKVPASHTRETAEATADPPPACDKCGSHYRWLHKDGCPNKPPVGSRVAP